MSKTWPFENEPEPKKKIRAPEDFVEQRAGSEAVIVRIGLNDAQMVLVDGDGGWDRWVYPSEEKAGEVANNLGVPVHVGEFPEDIRVRMNVHQRRDFDPPYPEQAEVGPVMPYPENRPRRVDLARKEVAHEALPEERQNP